MKATLIAYTEVDHGAMAEAEPAFIAHEDSTAAEDLIEFAGRSCYQSWQRPTPATATIEGYCENIIDSGHFSVLEHASATFYLVGVSRSLTHELVRHRHFSYSQLSQRFVDESDVEFILPPALLALALEAGKTEEEARAEWNAALREDYMDGYAAVVQILTEAGTFTRKQIREAARALLPNATETRIVVTANHRAWRDFFSKRHSVHADAEIQQLAKEVLGQLRTIAPNFYTDINQEPTS